MGKQDCNWVDAAEEADTLTAGRVPGTQDAAVAVVVHAAQSWSPS